MRTLFTAGFLLFLFCPGAVFSADLEVGARAPDFTLPYATKDTILHAGIRLSDRVGITNVVLAFYPADWSGGCTREMCTLRDNFSALATLGAEVFGISGDYVFSHREWAKHLTLQFALLSDHDHAVARAYQSYNEKSGYNLRTVFVIDRNGTIAYADRAYTVTDAASFDALRNALQRLK
jgi:peroxiredoxin